MMKVNGRWHWGRITYQAVVDPERAGPGHCTDCQRLTGSAYRATVLAPAETFTLHGGPPKIYVKTADSGTKRAHAFCPECGSPVYSAALGEPQTYSLRVGCLEQRREITPRRQQWGRSAPPWSIDRRDV